MMQTIQGDLVQYALGGHFDVIIHGCNCFCTMGAGIAKAIQTEFPEALRADRATNKGDRRKLGRYSQVTVQRKNHRITIINAYTQFEYRGQGVKADYTAIRKVFHRLKVEFSGKRFGFPLIGAGLAGGDWQIISAIIAEELQGEEYTLVRFVRSP